jgi:hypothetical protein
VERLTLAVGGALVVVGVVVFLGSGAESVTALLPAVLGAVLCGCATAARRPQRRRAALHVAAGVGVLGVMGSSRFINALPDFIDGTGEASGWAVVGQIVAFVLCGVHTVAAIRSFRRARAGGATA